VIKSDLALRDQELETASARLAERDARITQMTSSFAWRLNFLSLGE
jgi:hypothetical protein